jgi:HEPN domain-containing protein
MQPITLEWIAKAEADFATAQRELGVTDRPNYDGVCFHAQQCVEKDLKAFLQESNIVQKCDNVRGVVRRVLGL